LQSASQEGSDELDVQVYNAKVSDSCIRLLQVTATPQQKGQHTEKLHRAQPPVTKAAGTVGQVCDEARFVPLTIAEAVEKSLSMACTSLQVLPNFKLAALLCAYIYRSRMLERSTLLSVAHCNLCNAPGNQ
jgi:hypothetical protein